MHDKVGMAVVGCGYWGSKHVRIVHQAPMLEVTLAVDSRQEPLDYITSQYPGVQVAKEFEAALDSDAAGIIIATPISTHFDLAKAALEARQTCSRGKAAGNDQRGMPRTHFDRKEEQSDPDGRPHVRVPPSG